MTNTNLNLRISANPSLSKAQVGDVVAVKVRLDTENTTVNAIEGSLAINGSYDVVSLSTADSAFSLWPTKPSFENGVISFTGGVPNGVAGSELQIFTVYLKPKFASHINFDFSSSVAYLNDGQGTKTNLIAENSGLAVMAKTSTQTNDLLSVIEVDKTPPIIVSVELGSDTSTFNGKNFLTITATDVGSGINRYEIKEGDLPAVRTGPIYVLQNQTSRSPIEIQVIDNAGNISAATYPTGQPNFLTIALIIIGIIALIIATFRNRK